MQKDNITYTFLRIYRLVVGIRQWLGVHHTKPSTIGWSVVVGLCKPPISKSLVTNLKITVDNWCEKHIQYRVMQVGTVNASHISYSKNVSSIVPTVPNYSIIGAWPACAFLQLTINLQNPVNTNSAYSSYKSVSRKA